MELKFRAYIKKDDVVADVEVISWEEEYVQCRVGEDVVLIDFKDVELMHSIGLKDKNSKDIYEGDIVKTKDGKLFEVVYNKEYARYQLGNKRTIMPLDCLEVVGNIYENKELLK